MKDILRPILELLVVLPGLLLGYFPVKSYLKQSPGRLAAWLFPLMACLCIGSGLVCYRLGTSTFLALAGVRTDRGSAWAPACSITPFAGSSC